MLAQFSELQSAYPELTLCNEDDGGGWMIQGLLRFSAEYNGERINDEYTVLIRLSSDYPDEVPDVYEIADRIPSGFHQFSDRRLCLGEPLAVKQKFMEEPNLLGYVNNCLIPYLYSFSYKKLYGHLPFGDLSHGLGGILEYYLELFDLKDAYSLVGLIAILAQGNYRGHNLCPCGIGKRLRSCHGEKVLKIMKLNSPQYFRKLYQSMRDPGLLADPTNPTFIDGRREPRPKQV